MPISGCHDLPLATFNLPSRNNLQNKPNSAATMSLPCRIASRQRSRNAGGMRRLAAEIPDIFIPLSRNDVRNDDDIFDSDVFPAGDSFTTLCSHSRSRTRPQNKRQQRHTTLTPRIAGPERCAACGRSASSACFHSMRPVKNDMQTDGERVGRAGLEPAT